MMNDWFVLLVMTLFIIAGGCASASPVVPTTCKITDQRGVPVTCKEGETPCFVCRIGGPMGNVK